MTLLNFYQPMCSYQTR